MSCTLRPAIVLLTASMYMLRPSWLSLATLEKVPVKGSRTPILIGPPAAADPAGFAEAAAAGLLAAAELANGAVDGAAELMTDEEAGAAPPQADSATASIGPESH